MKRNVMIDDMPSEPNADLGENKCDTVIVKLLFIITNYSCDIEMWVITSFARRYYVSCKTFIPLNVK